MVRTWVITIQVIESFISIRTTKYIDLFVNISEGVEWTWTWTTFIWQGWPSVTFNGELVKVVELLFSITSTKDIHHRSNSISSMTKTSGRYSTITSWLGPNFRAWLAQWPKQCKQYTPQSSNFLKVTYQNWSWRDHSKARCYIHQIQWQTCCSKKKQQFVILQEEQNQVPLR